MSKEPLKGTLYWREVRNGLFVHNEDWDKTIVRLPGLLSAAHTLSRLQSYDQLIHSGMKGTGTIGLRTVEVEPRPFVLMGGQPILQDGFNVEVLFLQWLYQFNLVDSISQQFYNIPLPAWPLPFLNLVEEALHAMTYIAALIFLFEEGAFKDNVTKRNFQYTEVQVRDKVEELTATLYSKCAEYGESFRRHGLQGTLPRLWDKIARFAQLSALGRAASYEPKKDSAKDLLGYCIIAWSLVHELEDHGVPNDTSYHIEAVQAQEVPV
jgi:hypothetical protein